MFLNFLSFLILISAVGLILVLNPINSLLCLMLTFIGSALYLLAFNIGFLSYIYLIVYIGAIAILFLFVIMLFNLKALTNASFGNKKRKGFLIQSFYIYVFFGLKFYLWFGSIIEQLIEEVNESDSSAFIFVDKLSNPEIFIFSDRFYTYYRYIFLITGIILLVSMVGAIVLALSTTEVGKKKTNNNFLNWI